jgi:hypothetical protein
MKISNTSTAFTLFGLHYLKQRKILIIIGAVLLVVGFFAAIAIGTIVINDVANNKTTPEGYPETQFLGISAYSYEYGSVFTTILGVFVLSGGVLMDSKKKKQQHLTK